MSISVYETRIHFESQSMKKRICFSFSARSSTDCNSLLYLSYDSITFFRLVKRQFLRPTSSPFSFLTMFFVRFITV